jgi:hypothetical protein
MMTPEEVYNWAANVKELEYMYVDENALWFSLSEIKSTEKILDLADKADCEVVVRNQNQKIFYGIKFSNSLDKFILLYDGLSKKTKNGIPDLSLVTCRQITAELKSRKNLTFVMFWIEEDIYDNINVEANGHLNTVVGLATRGLNLILKATDEKTRYADPDSE